MTLWGFQASSDARIAADVARLNKELTRHYRAALDDIADQLAALHRRILAGVAEEDYYAVAIKSNRLRTLQRQTAAAFGRAHTAAAGLVTEGAELAFVNSYYQNSYALTGPSAVQGIELGFNVMPEELVELAVTGQTPTFKGLAARYGAKSNYKPPAGTLADILVNRRATDLQRVQDTIVQTLIQGKSPRDAARVLDRALAIGRNNAQRILVTEVHRTMNLGHYAATQNARSEGVDVKRIINSTLDDRTRRQSVQVDGQIEGTDGMFTYPGGVKVLVPGSSGVAGWDINDREAVYDIVAGVEPTARRMRIPGDRPPPAERDALRAAGLPIPGETYIIEWQKFERWASANGLTRNRFGQLVVGT